MQYGYNTRTGQKLAWSQFFDGDPYWQMISFEELWKLNHGVSWQGILEARGLKHCDNVVATAERIDEPVAKEVGEAEDGAEDEFRMTAGVPGRPRKKNGRKRSKFADVNKKNVTVEMVEDLEDEELHEFSRRVLNKEFCKVDGLGEEDRLRMYEHIRSEIKKRVVKIVGKRDGRVLK